MKNTRNLVGSLFLALVLATAVSCSSNDKKDESSSADVAEAATDAGAPADGSGDQAAAPADGSGDQAAAPADGAQANGDQPPADNAQASTDPNAAPPADADAAALDAPPDASAAAAAPESKEGDVASADQPPADPNSPPPGADATAPPPADGAPAVADNTTPPPPTEDAAAAPPADTTSAGADAFGAAAASDAAPKKKSGGKLAHIKDAPFTKGGQNLNTVYIARDGDTLDSISQKLFGEDKTKQLAKANPTLKKSVKTGDKVYFNSPSRPDDKEKMMTVYEDQGLPPTPYTTKDGDTLKSLAQEWYGSEASYKEIYAINKNLTSTKELPAGTDLQYWPATAQVSVYNAKKDEVVAQANPPPPPSNPPGMNPPGGMPGGNPPGGAPGNPGMPGGPGAPGGMPGNMANQPPGGMPPNAAGQIGGPNNPGAPGMPGANPPGMAPPPPDLSAAMPKPRKPKDLSASSGGMDKDTVFYAGVAGILLVASALWFAFRRRKARNSGVTQI